MRNLLLCSSHFMHTKTIAWNIFPSLWLCLSFVYFVRWLNDPCNINFFFFCLLLILCIASLALYISLIPFSDWFFRISIQIGWYYRNNLPYTSDKPVIFFKHIDNVRDEFTFFFSSTSRRNFAKSVLSEIFIISTEKLGSEWSSEFLIGSHHRRVYTLYSLDIRYWTTINVNTHTFIEILQILSENTFSGEMWAFVCYDFTMELSNMIQTRKLFFRFFFLQPQWLEHQRNWNISQLKDLVKLLHIWLRVHIFNISHCKERVP